MRTALLLSVLVLAACDGRHGTLLTGPDTEPVAGMFTVSGVVIDSLSGGAIPGVRVASGPYVTDADAAGQWSLVLPAAGVALPLVLPEPLLAGALAAAVMPAANCDGAPRPVPCAGAPGGAFTVTLTLVGARSFVFACAWWSPRPRPPNTAT